MSIDSVRDMKSINDWFGLNEIPKALINWCGFGRNSSANKLMKRNVQIIKSNYSL